MLVWQPFIVAMLGKKKDSVPRIISAAFAAARYAVTFHEWDAACVADGAYNGKPHEPSQEPHEVFVSVLPRSNGKELQSTLFEMLPAQP